MGSLGWEFGSWKADYRISLPKLSPEESELVLAVSKRFRDAAQKNEVGEGREAEELVGKMLSEECEEQGIGLDAEQEKYLAKAACLHSLGAGFLQELLDDPSLEEIAVIGIGQPIFAYVRGKGWKKTNVAIENLDCFVSLVNRLGRNLGRRLTAQRPRINAVIDGGSRMHASMPPVSPCELTVRKFGREPFSP